MGLQEIIVLVIVLVAGFFTVRKFIRQFTRDENEAPGCAKCELNKAVKAKQNAK